jgi:5-methylcytosine-specific restriction protein B
MANSFLEMSNKRIFELDEIGEVNSELVKFFGELKKIGAEFGYRTASEILRLINQLNEVDGSLTLNEKIDIAIIQKLLPKLHGSRRKLSSPLETLGRFCISAEINVVKDVFDNSSFDFKNSNVKYPLSLEKIDRMYRSAFDNGFASFAEA